MARTEVMAEIGVREAVRALRRLVLDGEDCDPRGWSLAWADDLEAVARKIREGIAEAKPAQRCFVCDSTGEIDAGIRCPECDGRNGMVDSAEMLRQVAASSLGRFLAARGHRPGAEYGWANARRIATELGWAAGA